MWIGTFGGGLDLFDRDTNTFNHYKCDDKDSDILVNNVVTMIYEDSKGNLWIGSYNDKLNFFDRKTKRFIQCKLNTGDINTSNIIRFTSMIEDNTGTLWIGSVGGGLFSARSDSMGCFNFVQYLHDEKNKARKTTNFTIDM